MVYQRGFLLETESLHNLFWDRLLYGEDWSEGSKRYEAISTTISDMLVFPDSNLVGYMKMCKLLKSEQADITGGVRIESRKQADYVPH